MKYFAIFLGTMFLAVPAFSQTGPYPLGTLVHQYQQKWELGKKTSQGWDPAFYGGADQVEKSRLLDAASFETFPVGLPNGLQPSDLGNTGCPSSDTIDGPSDVSDLPTVSLSGVQGPVYLIHDCNRTGATLCLKNNMKVALHGSVYGRVEYNCGASSSESIWVVDSVLDADYDQPAGIRTGGMVTYVAYSEILGGDDSAKVGQDDTFYRVHFHGYDRDSRKEYPSNEHNDTVQVQGSGSRDWAIINSTLDGPFQAGQTAWLSHCQQNCRFTENLVIGGDGAIRTGETVQNNVAIYNNQVLADQLGASFDTYPCQINAPDNPANFQGEGNTATDGSLSGPIAGDGTSWNFGSCNREPVNNAHKSAVASIVSKMETWVSQIREAAGTPVSARISVSASPPLAFSAVPVVLTAAVTGCVPARYDFECGDTSGAFDDGSSSDPSISCGTMAPGTYSAEVRASGGTCESPLLGGMLLTVSPPPAPVLY